MVTLGQVVIYHPYFREADARDIVANEIRNTDRRRQERRDKEAQYISKLQQDSVELQNTERKHVLRLGQASGREHKLIQKELDILYKELDDIEAELQAHKYKQNTLKRPVAKSSIISTINKSAKKLIEKKTKSLSAIITNIYTEEDIEYVDVFILSTRKSIKKITKSRGPRGHWS